jgi:hypothetical protein
LDREQAVTLLKQLTLSNLVDLSWVSIESYAGDYKLKIKAIQRTPELEQFFSKNNAKLEEQNGYWLISKP